MNSLIIDLNKMADEYQLPRADSVRPDGVVMMRNEPVWDSEALRRAVAEVKARAAAAQYDRVEVQAHCPNWVTAALNYAAAPAVGYAQIGPNGMYKLDMNAFPFGEIDPSLNTRFEVREEGDLVYVTLVPIGNADAGAHGFDLTRFDEICVPAIPAGKRVLLAGEMVNPIAVCMALAYAPEAKAVYLRFHQNPYYYCCISSDPEIPLGDMIAAE